MFESEEDHVFKGHPQVFHELDAEAFDNIIETAIATKREGGNTALVLDDFSEQLKLKKTEFMLRKLINKHRHMKLNIIISALNQRSLAKNLRSLIDVIVLFTPLKI